MSRKEKQCDDLFVCGLMQGEHCHTVNGVKYIVSSCFEDSPEKNINIRERFGRLITGCFTDWTKELADDRFDTEYVCSTAGEED